MKHILIITAFLIASLQCTLRAAYVKVSPETENIYSFRLSDTPVFGNDDFSYDVMLLASKYAATLIMVHTQTPESWNIPKDVSVKMYFQGNDDVSLKLISSSDFPFILSELNFGILSNWNVDLMNTPIDEIIGHVMATLATREISNMQIEDHVIWSNCHPSPDEFRSLFDAAIERFPNASYANTYRRLMRSAKKTIERHTSTGIPHGELNVADIVSDVLGYNPVPYRKYAPEDIATAAKSNKGWTITFLGRGNYGWDNLTAVTIGPARVTSITASPYIQNDVFLSDVSAELICPISRLNSLVSIIRKQLKTSGWTEVEDMPNRLCFYKGNTIVECWWSEEQDSVEFTINAQKYQSNEIVKSRIFEGVG